MKVDMSPKAVKGRLKLVSELWRLSLSLGKAKKETDKRRKNKDITRNTDQET
jgi:tmRNA-binding protein